MGRGKYPAGTMSDSRCKLKQGRARREVMRDVAPGRPSGVRAGCPGRLCVSILGSCQDPTRQSHEQPCLTSQLALP